MTLNELSTTALLDELTTLLGAERRTVARLIAYLVEVEDRRAHLEAGCSSLFDFCQRKLGFSEGEAFRRINAARLARRFPIIVDLVEAGRVHLSALVMLREHLTDDNHAQLLAEASGKSKRGLEELLAARFPRPDVAATIRKLSERAAADRTGVVLAMPACREARPHVASAGRSASPAPGSAAPTGVASATDTTCGQLADALRARLS